MRLTVGLLLCGWSPAGNVLTNVTDRLDNVINSSLQFL